VCFGFSTQSSPRRHGVAEKTKQKAFRNPVIG
jgi:hypothetical protein